MSRIKRIKLDVDETKRIDNLVLSGQNRNKDIGLEVHLPVGSVLSVYSLIVSNCFINLVKTGDGLVRIEHCQFSEFGGDASNIRGSNVEIGNYLVRDNTPTRPYANCYREGNETIAECLARHGEVVFDPDLLDWEHDEKTNRFYVQGYHVDAGAHIYAVKKDGWTVDPDGLIENVVIRSVDVEVTGRQSQAFMLSEACRYRGIDIGKDGYRVLMDGYPYHFVANTLESSRIGCADGCDVVPGTKVRIDNVKSGKSLTSNVVLVGLGGVESCEGDAFECKADGGPQVFFVDAAAVREDPVGEMVKDQVMNKEFMAMSNGGLRQLIESEDSRNTVYYCQAGLPTIGVGHVCSQSEMNSGKIVLASGQVIDFRDNRPIDDAEIMALLDDDLPRFERAVNESVMVPIDQGNADALIHFAFNIGVGAFKGSTLLKELNGMQYQEVPRQIKKWKYVTIGGVKQVSKGLVKRRKKEVFMWHSSSNRSDAQMDEWVREAAKPAVDDSVDLVAAAEALGVSGESEFLGDMGPVAMKDGDVEVDYSGDDGFEKFTAQADALAKRYTGSQVGFDATLEHARQQAQVELENAKDSIRAEAIREFQESHKYEKWSDSRTNRSVLGMLVTYGLTALVGSFGLPDIFASPEVASMITGAVETGLGAGTALLGVAAIRFRVAATKFIG